jgi:Copper transport outer membrane protein, MctB
MIDFRYHLISIVAVFLALGVGVLMGSAFLGQVIKKSVKAQITYVKNRNEALHATNADLSRRIEQNARFANDVEPWLLNNRLIGHRIVVLTFEGTEDGLVGEATQHLERAGATVISTVTLNAKLALSDATARQALTRVLRAPSADEADLRAELARRLGSGLASSARGSLGVARRRLDGLLADLEDAGFLSAQRETPRTVPPASLFAVVGGSPDPPPFDLTGFTVALVKRLYQQPVIVAEPSDSVWNLVASVRNDGAARSSVSTEDAMETPQGEIALVLGLLLEDDGLTGHYGVKAGAESVIPKPLGG